MLQRQKMVGVDNESKGGQRRQRQTTMVADNDGTQDQVVDYNGEGQEWEANNNGIRHKAMKPAGNQSCEERMKSSLPK